MSHLGTPRVVEGVAVHPVLDVDFTSDRDRSARPSDPTPFPRFHLLRGWRR